MTTALTVYQANAASTTTGLTTANQLYAGSSGSPAVNQLVTVLGTATGYGEILPRGGTAWAAGGSLPSPSGNGFVLDTSQLNLSGQQIVAGNWSAEVRFCAMQSGSQAGTLVADIYVRAYKYSSGTYTNIVAMKLASQTINSTLTTYLIDSAHSATGLAGSTVTFSSGDVLYMDIILNITTNSNANVNQGVRNNRMSTDTTGFVGDVNASLTTPGYQSAGTVTSLTITETATGTEMVTAALAVPVVETATGSETVTAGYSLPITESATGSEIVTAALAVPITENAPGSEIVTSVNSYNLSILESATGSEIVTAGNLVSTTVTETATGSETVTFSYGTVVTIVETATGSEIVTIFAGNNNTIQESATGSEIVTFINAQTLAVLEAAPGSEIVTAGLLVTVVESATGSETLTAITLTKGVVSVTENAPGSETVVMFQGIQSPGNVQMQKGDLATQYSRIYASVTGPQLKLLATTYYGNANNNQVIYGELDAVMSYEAISSMHVMKTINDVNAFLLSTEYIANVLNDTPIAYYRLTESSGSTVYDYSSRNYSATITGGVTLGAAGALSQSSDTSMLFDGSTGYITLPISVDSANWTGLTVECWINLSNATFGTSPRIISNGNAGVTLQGFDINLQPSASGGYVTITKSGASLLGHFTTVLSASTWYHFVATYNQSAIVIYINGSQVSSTAVSGSTIPTASNQIALGYLPGVNNQFFPGKMQSVALYNYALSSTRVLAHYNAGVSP